MKAPKETIIRIRENWSRTARWKILTEQLQSLGFMFMLCTQWSVNDIEDLSWNKSHETNPAIDTKFRDLESMFGTFTVSNLNQVHKALWPVEY